MNDVPSDFPCLTGLSKNLTDSWEGFESYQNKYAVCLLFVYPITSARGCLAIPQLVFTRRCVDLRSHKGQISLPGGRAEAYDLSPMATALREMEEEIGLSSQIIDVVGELPVASNLQGEPIIPVVARCSYDLTCLTHNTKEVAEVIGLPYVHFAQTKRMPFRFFYAGQWRESPLFMPTVDMAIWGITARILESAGIS